jgi:hypothetical protein
LLTLERSVGDYIVKGMTCKLILTEVNMTMAVNVYTATLRPSISFWNKYCFFSASKKLVSIIDGTMEGKSLSWTGSVTFLNRPVRLTLLNILLHGP